MSTTLQFKLGRDEVFILQVLKNGMPYSLQDCQLFVSCKLTQELAAAPLFTKSIGAGITVLPGDEGKFELEIAAADKAALSDLVIYFWDTLLITPEGQPVTPDELEGTILVTSGVTAVPTP